MSRRSYSGLMRLPAWWLFDGGAAIGQPVPDGRLRPGERLVASVRAATADDARRLFKDAGLTGTHMRRGR